MSIKLVAADIDGTLVTDEKILLPATKKAIEEFTDNGGIFVIASGRPVKGIMRYITELELNKKGGFVISYNGSLILDAKTLKPVRKSYIDVETAREVVLLSDAYNVPITTYIDDSAVTQRSDDKYFYLETSINTLNIKRVKSLYDEISAPVPKFLITGEPDVIEKTELLFKNKLKKVTVFRSEPFFLEIVPENVNKGSSLAFLSDYLGFSKNETLACGDGYNDISLLKEAGIGVAMLNSQKPVIEAADFVTLSNNDDGVGEAIRNFVLNPIKKNLLP